MKGIVLVTAKCRFDAIVSGGDLKLEMGWLAPFRLGDVVTFECVDTKRQVRGHVQSFEVHSKAGYRVVFRIEPMQTPMSFAETNAMLAAALNKKTER